MKASFGTARIGLTALLGVAAVAILTTTGLHRSSGRAYGGGTPTTLFVTDSCAQAVLAVPASGNGDIAPPASGTGLGSPHYVAFDKNGNIYVSNGFSNDVTFLPRRVVAMLLLSPRSAGPPPACPRQKASRWIQRVATSMWRMQGAT
jgi:hypothetical protein